MSARICEVNRYAGNKTIFRFCVQVDSSFEIFLKTITSNETPDIEYLTTKRAKGVYDAFLYSLTQRFFLDLENSEVFWLLE